MSFWHSPKADIQVSMNWDSRALVGKMARLTGKEQMKESARVARQSMQIVRRAAIANAQAIDNPNDFTEMYKNVVVQASPKQGRRHGGVVMRVGLLGGARKYATTPENRRLRRVGKTYKTSGNSANPGGDTWYWRFVEFGTAKWAGKPFLEQALSSNAQKVTDDVGLRMNKVLDKLFPEQPKRTPPK